MWRWTFDDLTMLRPRSPNAIAQRDVDMACQPGDEFSFAGDITTGSFDLLQLRATVDPPPPDS